MYAKNFLLWLIIVYVLRTGKLLFKLLRSKDKCSSRYWEGRKVYYENEIYWCKEGGKAIWRTLKQLLGKNSKV